MSTDSYSYVCFDLTKLTHRILPKCFQNRTTSKTVPKQRVLMFRLGVRAIKKTPPYRRHLRPMTLTLMCNVMELRVMING